MPDSPLTQTQKLPGVVVVRVTAEKIDETNLSSLRSAVAMAGEQSPGDAVAIDMSNVTFMPSVSLGGLIQLSQLFKARKQRFFLAGLQPSVREMLVLTRLDRIFELRADLSEFESGSPKA
ncbi:MAG: STAS domain-containing protein [Phycisphaeraceae bacterium]|nr:STAS domain-containing protein [Phycisphaeraceae bacterium]